LESNDILITDARVWRASQAQLDEAPTALRIRSGRIVALGRTALEGEPAAKTLALPGRVILPGLIDGHVHLELDPRLATPAEQLAVPAEARVRAMAARARAMLGQGITTARDCGGGAFFEHALRDRIARGEALGPRLLCCGQPLTTPGGHCAFWGGVVSEASGLERVVGRQVEAGSDWIKVMATGGVFTPGSRPRDTQFDANALATIVAAARRSGRPVAAHCHGTAGIAAALRAGVRTIEHASFAGPDGFGTDLDEALVRELAASDVFVAPTVNAGWLRRIRDAEGAPTDFFRRLSRSLGLQRMHGVRLLASSDAGIPGVFHDALAGGLEALSAFAAMRPVDVLRAATVDAAEALGLSQETGRIEPGLSADLMVVRGDPTQDLAVLRDPEAVSFRGRWLDGAWLRAGAPADGIG
jgi:imidazolonepropionase-like amidohydrolase